MRVKKQINIEIGERIKHARENAGFTQERFAEMIDVSPQYISDLERGIVGVSIETFKKVCISLRVSSDNILFGTDTNGNLNALVEKCKVLSDKQCSCLLNITDNFIEAIQLNDENTPS